jgi:hypothetical protein
LFSRLGCPGNTPGKNISFFDFLLFSSLGCPNSMPGRGIPFPDCLLLVRRLGCPGSTPGRGILFPDCLLLFSSLGCLGSTHGRGIPFPDCLLLFSRLGCPGSTHGRRIPFPHCLLLFSRLGCRGSTPGRGIPFPDCLLLFSRLGCPGSTPGRGIPFPHCLLLFSPLHYTQSPRTVTHLSHTHYVCEAPPDNPLLLASCNVATHINSFFLFFFLGLKSIFYIAFFSDFVGFFFSLCRKQTNGGEIPLERERKKRSLLSFWSALALLSSRVSCSTIPKHLKLLAYECF